MSGPMTMQKPTRFSLKRTDLPGVVLSLLVLVPCIYYPYIANVALDFGLSNQWKVITGMPCPPDQDCPKVGDRILAIGDITYERFSQDRTLEMLEAYGPVTTLRIERNGKVMDLRIHTRPPETRAIALKLPPAALFPVTFWLLGTVLLLFLRPRDERWLVLILFSYTAGLWFASGMASGSHAAYSAVIFHLVIWAFCPLCIHLHLILPSSLLSQRRRWQILIPLYAATLAVTVLDAFYVLGPYTHAFIVTTGGAILLSLGLLILRLVLPLEGAVKLATRILLYGLVLGLGPFLLIFIVLPYSLPRFSQTDLRFLQSWLIFISLMSVPILPMSYVYAIYRHHVGALEFRANRLLGLYSFAIIWITFFVAALLLVSNQEWKTDIHYIVAMMFTSLAFASAIFLRKPYQNLVDRHIFGIRYSSERVVELVSERIPTAFDRSILARVVSAEILPTLLIRQSALYLFDPSSEGMETLFEQAVPADGRPGPAELRDLLERSGRYLHPSRDREDRLGWVRLAIPLVVQTETIGVWLLGRRDPDDAYPSADIHLLTTVANQIAPMVENIRLYERAQQEIAQRKAAEEEIRRSEERFRTLFEATLEGIAIVRNGVILEVNHALLGIFGYPPDAPEELIGRPLPDLVSEGAADLDDAPREGLGFKRDGAVVDIEIAGKRFVFQGEDVTVVAVRDIASRKRNEAENKMLQRQLLLSQKMEAIGRLSAGVAHDFNNCLLAIFGYNDLMLDRYGDDPFLARNLTGLKEAGQKAAGLTKQLLAFARRQPMETRVLELNPVVTGLEKMMQRLLGEDIHMAVELTPGLDPIKVDPGQIEQVIVNLAVNARHAMPTGGRLTIRTAAVKATPEEPALHQDVPPGSYVLLTVADTGIGMDAETQTRVFEPFFSTKKGEGTGLGLATAYGIVRQSGGHIFVDSAPGQGATFSIYLPVTREAKSVLPAHVPDLDDTGTETILLVEDEAEARSVVHQILIGKGYRVIQAESGDEALAMSRMFRGPIHLLLTDVIMPRMKGPELAGRLLRDRPDTKVVYMSGYNDELIPAEETVLQKPFFAQDLTQKLRMILDAEDSLPRTATA
jgi:two-component system, cell cycle sensor histidine kinase and response regulator CckA